MDTQKITDKIATLQKAIKTSPTQVLTEKLKTKISELRQVLKDSNISTTKLATTLLASQKKVAGYSKDEFNGAIKRLSARDEYSFLRGMAKGKVKDDLKRFAKPVGWRFKGRNNIKKPTAKELAIGKKNGTVYYEDRVDRSDVVRPAKLKTGGVLKKDGSPIVVSVINKPKKDRKLSLYYKESEGVFRQYENGKWLSDITETDLMNRINDGSVKVLYKTGGNTGSKKYKQGGVAGDDKKLKMENIERFLSRFPNNATSWGQATDEIADLNNNIGDYIDGYKGATYVSYGGELPNDTKSTPAKRNTNHKKAILKYLPTLSDRDFDSFYNDHKEWYEKSFKTGGNTGSKKYKLGDEYSSDFDYDGMLEMGLKSDIKWGEAKLRKLHDSFEDVNYHTASKPLWSAIQYLKDGRNSLAKLQLIEFHKLVEKELTGEDDGERNVGEDDQYAKGGMVVTKIAKIPNFKQRLDEGKITYRGLGMGKLYDDFYKLAGEGGTRIKVDGKEYYITDTEFNTFSRGADGKMRIRFDAPQRKYGKGANIENAEMVLNNNKQIAHHTKELASAVKGKEVPAWVVAKVNRSASDLSDATHYLDGAKFGKGGAIGENVYIVDDKSLMYKKSGVIIGDIGNDWLVKTVGGTGLVRKNKVEVIKNFNTGGNLGWATPQADYLSASDWEDLASVKEQVDAGNYDYAMKLASSLDTIVRDEIPSDVWVKMGGYLTESGQVRFDKGEYGLGGNARVTTMPKEQYERIHAEIESHEMKVGGGVSTVIDKQVHAHDVCRKHNCTYDDYNNAHKEYGLGGALLLAGIGVAGIVAYSSSKNNISEDEYKLKLYKKGTLQDTMVFPASNVLKAKEEYSNLGYVVRVARVKKMKTGGGVGEKTMYNDQVWDDYTHKSFKELSLDDKKKLAVKLNVSLTYLASSNFSDLDAKTQGVVYRFIKEKNKKMKTGGGVSKQVSFKEYAKHIGIKDDLIEPIYNIYMDRSISSSAQKIKISKVIGKDNQAKLFKWFEYDGYLPSNIYNKGGGVQNKVIKSNDKTGWKHKTK